MRPNSICDSFFVKIGSILRFKLATRDFKAYNLKTPAYRNTERSPKSSFWPKAARQTVRAGQPTVVQAENDLLGRFGAMDYRLPTTDYT